MKRCLIIINKLSGRAKSIDLDAIKAKIGKDYIFDCKSFDDELDVKGYDTLAVCGGDGTLSSVMDLVKDLSIQVVYFPYGTVNDRARTAAQCSLSRCVLGDINGKTFTYVAACGTFTAIGYITRLERKRKFKSLAYFFQAFSEYRVHRIRAAIRTDSHVFEGDYTLIMIIKSKHCFYFPFNKLYNEEDLNAHLLLIKAPKGKGIIAYIQLFFRFFRVFFIGLRKKIHKKHITFIPTSQLQLNLAEATDFCVDGEKLTLKGEVNVSFRYACPTFILMQRKDIKKSKKNTRLDKKAKLNKKVVF